MCERLHSQLKKIKKPTQLVEIAQTIQAEVLSHLDEQGIELFDDLYDLPSTSLKPLVTQTKSLLEETITQSQSPLKVSLMGPFSSGKTITLCTLLKQPNLLPRSAQPTSGNVVEIQIVPPQSANQTQVMQCVLFSLLELETMLRDYYTYLQNHYGSGLKPLPEQSGFLREQIHILCKDIRGLLENKWLEHQQGTRHFPVQGLTHIAHLYFILLTIRNYLQKYPQISQTTPLILNLPYDFKDKKTQEWLMAVTMLDMQWSLSEMAPARLEEKARKLTEILPTELDEFKQICEQGQISNEALRTLLPLYQRIILTQEVDIEDWPGIERITFLDLPGTGSDNRRDAYLGLQALPETHVNLLFFLANKPTIAEAQPLIDMMMEAKQHLQQFDHRLIPIISFFDTYAQWPPEVDPEQEAQHPEFQQRAWHRVQAFFSQQKLEDVDGLKEGFDVFDQSLLGPLFTQQGDWNYHLLSPTVAMDNTLLTDNENNYLTTYRYQSARYGQLLQDLTTSIRYLKNQDRQQYSTEIEKYERLKEALQAYQADGGLQFLREELIDRLKENGLHFILEDARQPLQQAIQRLDQELITKLREAVDLAVLNDPAQVAVDNKAARDRVMVLWDEMHALTRYWASAGQIKLMHRGAQVSGSHDSTDNAYIDPLELCETQVLRTVLENDFWQTWAQNWLTPTHHQSSPLTNLVQHYHQLETMLDEWTTQAIDQTIADTLEKLDQEVVEIDRGIEKKRQSFKALRESLEQDYLRGDQLDLAEKNNLKKWFSLTALAADLRVQLEEQKLQHKNLEPRNDKVPFNDHQDFNWSAVEMMKVQRQMILTLQRRVAHEFAYYTAAFAQAFQQQLNNRFHDRSHSLDQFKTECLQPGGIFDRLAEVPLPDEETEKPTPSSMTRKERKRQAQMKAALILETWDQLF